MKVDIFNGVVDEIFNGVFLFVDELNGNCNIVLGALGVVWRLKGVLLLVDNSASVKGAPFFDGISRGVVWLQVDKLNGVLLVVDKGAGGKLAALPRSHPFDGSICNQSELEYTSVPNIVNRM